MLFQFTIEKLWPGRELSPCKYRLRSYTDEPIRVLGVVDVVVTYKSQTAQLPLIVVEGDGPSLLGRNWPQHTDLDWLEIRHVSCSLLQVLLDKHQSVFQEGLGTLKNLQAKIHIDPNAKPQFCKTRTGTFNDVCVYLYIYIYL